MALQVSSIASRDAGGDGRLFGARDLDDRERRLGQNEALYREVNERVSDQARRQALSVEEVYEFVCECSNLDCTLRVEISLSEYEAVRAHARRFIVAVGHDLPEAETVVEQTDRYWVIEKDEEAGEVAETLDPRSR
jgi:hypothetical protein